MKNTITTLDGYEYILIYRQPTSMNTLCVYKIQKKNEDTVYFLASSELSDLKSLGKVAMSFSGIMILKMN